MNNVSLRSLNSHALNNAVIYSELEPKRPARNTEIFKVNTATASVSFRLSRAPEYKNPNSPSIAMNSSVLCPPNSHTLSETVIYGVVETKRSARNIETTRVQYPQQCRTSDHILSAELERARKGEDSVGFAITTCSSRPIDTSSEETATSTRRLLAHETRIHTMTGSKPEATRDLTAYEVTARQAIEERSQMRALRRERQIRYRKKKHDYMLRLEAETRILREQIKNLTQRRGSLCKVDSTKDNVWNVAVDYFKHFCFGLQAAGQFTTSSTIVSSVQLSFLRTALSPDVIFNTQQGFETIITHWRYITYAFQALEMEVGSLVRSVDGSLIAITRTSISISEHTLRSVFPHLCDDGDEDLNRLGGKLVGRRFHMLGVTRFEWSAASQRVSSVTAQSDMLTPMLRLLGNLEDVSRVFHKSRVSSAFQWNGTNPCMPVSY